MIVTSPMPIKAPLRASETEMTYLTKVWLGVALALAITGSAEAQLASGAASRDRNGMSEFLNRKSTQHDQRHAALVTRGMKTESERMLALVNGSTLTMPTGTPASTESQITTLKRSFTIDVAQYLTAVGLTASGVRELNSKGFDAVGSAAALIRGKASISDLTLLADTVILARAVGREDSRAAKDGYRSNTIFVVSENLKGSSRVGDKVVLRQQSGLEADGSRLNITSDVVAIPGKLYLLVLSNSWYEQQVLERNHQLTPSKTKHVALFGAAYEVDNASLRPLRSGVPRAASIANIRRTLTAQNVR